MKMNPPNKLLSVDAIATNLRVAAAKLKISYTDIATAVGVSVATVSGWMSGRCSPRLGDFIALCRVLKVKPNEVLGFR